jgi:hypothetical protein
VPARRRWLLETDGALANVVALLRAANRSAAFELTPRRRLPEAPWLDGLKGAGDPAGEAARAIADLGEPP